MNRKNTMLCYEGLVIADYAENSLAMSVSLLSSIDLHSFYILHLHTSFIFLLLCNM